MKIYKYKVEFQHIYEIPDMVKIIHFDYQNGLLHFWAEMGKNPPHAHNTHPNFIIHKIGTGWNITNKQMVHLSTMEDGPFMWHYYMELIIK